MVTILKFSSKNTNKKPAKGKILDSSITIGLWSVDPIDGGILEQVYPQVKSLKEEAVDKISLKIKNLINITVRDMTFKSEWSLSPLTVDSHHYYLYGFFLDKWRVISIHLPVELSLWLIETKSNSLFYESNISTKIYYFPISEWEKQILVPIYEDFLNQKELYDASIDIDDN